MENQSRFNNLARRLAQSKSRRTFVAALGASAATLVAGHSARADDWWTDDLGDEVDNASADQPVPGVCEFVVDYASIIWKGTLEPGTFYYVISMYVNPDLLGLSAHISVEVPGNTTSLGWFPISEFGQIGTETRESSFDLRAGSDSESWICYDQATISVSVGPVSNSQCQYRFEAPAVGC